MTSAGTVEEKSKDAESEYGKTLPGTHTKLGKNRSRPMPSFQTRFDELKLSAALPSPTGVAMEIIRLSRSADATSADWTKLVQADPALAGRVIKLANSIRADAGRPVVSIAEAVRHLGLPNVSSVGLAFAVVGQRPTGSSKAFRYDSFWSLSFARAVATRELARRLKGMPEEEAFTCGLLCRIGELAFATAYPAEYDELLTASTTTCNADERLNAERMRFGITSIELSAAMLNDWRLPDVFVDAVLEMAAPSAEPFRSLARHKKLAAILGSAQRLAAFCLENPDRSKTESPDAWRTIAGREIDRLGIDRDLLPRLYDDVVSNWREWGDRNHGTPLADSLLPKRAPEFATETGHPYGPKDRNLTNGLVILVVDDNDSQRRLLGNVLCPAGHSVISADNGETALRLALEHQPDVVIADWQMPKMDGLQLCDALRQTKIGRPVYFVLITGDEDEEVLVEAFERGVDDFVTKPFRPRALQSRVKAAQRIIGVENEIRRERADLRRLGGELALANRKLESASLTDFLTDLPNRRFLMQSLDQQWSAATRNDHELSCLLVDVDHFKSVNDRYGHALGDAVLQELATVLRQYKRNEDVACRYGGEEFAIVLPDTGPDVAVQVAERLRLAAEREIAARTSVVPRPITISIGVAFRTIESRTANDLLNRADQALYRAKEAGRNRVCIMEEPIAMLASMAPG
jgi:two-component system, cell cycle response regulator